MPPTVLLVVSNKCIAVRKVATPLRELTCHIGSHSVTCHPAEETFPPTVLLVDASISTDVNCSRICLSVCVISTPVSHAKAAEPIEMPLGSRLAWAHETTMAVRIL